MSSERAHTPTILDALALLALPALGRLSDQQVRGITCVWGGEALTTGMAVDLGVRQTQRAGDPVSWYPRACRRCVHDTAYAALLGHASGCGLCETAQTLDECETGVTLRHLMREYRR